jgi:hypothetical protein
LTASKRAQPNLDAPKDLLPKDSPKKNSYLPAVVAHTCANAKLLAQKPLRVNPAKYLIFGVQLGGNQLAQNEMFLGSGLCA